MRPLVYTAQRLESWNDLGLAAEVLTVEALVALVLVEVLVVVALVVVVLEKVVSVVVAGAFKSQVSHHRDFNNLLNNPLSKNSISHQRGMLLPPSTHGKFTGHLSIPDLKGLWNSDDNKNLLLLNKMLVIE